MSYRDNGFAGICLRKFRAPAGLEGKVEGKSCSIMAILGAGSCTKCHNVGTSADEFRAAQTAQTEAFLDLAS